MGVSAVSPRPLDRSIEQLLANEPAGALGAVLPLIEARPDAAALLLAGKALALLGSASAAEETLKSAVSVAVRARSLSLAAGAVHALRELDVDVTAELQRIGDALGRPRAEAAPAAPPVLEGETLTPIDATPAELEARALAAAKSAELAKVTPSGISPTEKLWLQLGPEGVRAFVRALELELVAAGHALIEEGGVGDSAYLAARGELEVRRGDTVLARLGAGNLFGEMALLSRSPRAASVVSVRPSIVLRADRTALDRVAELHPELGQVLAKYCRRRMIENLVRTSAVLRPLRAAERHALLDKFVTRTFETGEKLISEGEEGSGIHLVASGSLAVVAGSAGEATRVAVLGAGDVVGEVAMVLRRPATAAVVADCPSVTLHLPASEFMAVIKQHPALLAELYTLAVERHDETRSLLAQQAEDASDLVLF